ncbi:MAG: ABC transporter ATP-binding protein, partial [Lachnospiraceae bacterium]|nr:ABC transporter ATP-binding protein [Lachnospiraceae bacterium]
MLKRMFHLTDAGQKAVYRSAIWLAAFQVLAMVPMLLIMHLFTSMYARLQGERAEGFPLAGYV